MKNQRKKIIYMLKKLICLLTVIFTVSGVVSGCGKQSEEKESEAISVYFWSVGLIDEYAPYIQSQLPDLEIEFFVGNNDLDFYNFLNENGALPDIIMNRRFSLHDAEKLKGQLMDLSETEIAASYYSSYLDNYRNSDRSVNWLPVCGEVDTLVANKALFEEYGIELPTDYESFVSACREFEKHGIYGFVSDFNYDYTCMEILQGLSIAELTSLDGQMWRMEYENPEESDTGLDSVIWPGVFERMEKFIKDANISPEQITYSYEDVKKMFDKGRQP